METSIPLIFFGAISATYIGASTDAAPTESPPTILLTTNATKVWERALPRHDKANSNAT